MAKRTLYLHEDEHEFLEKRAAEHGSVSAYIESLWLMYESGAIDPGSRRPRTVSIMDKYWTDMEQEATDQGLSVSKLLEKIFRVDMLRVSKRRGGKNQLLVTHRGRKRPLQDVCAELDINPVVVINRLHRGKTDQQALEEPMQGSYADYGTWQARHSSKK